MEVVLLAGKAARTSSVSTRPTNRGHRRTDVHLRTYVRDAQALSQIIKVSMIYALIGHCSLCCLTIGGMFMWLV